MKIDFIRLRFVAALIAAGSTASLLAASTIGPPRNMTRDAVRPTTKSATAGPPSVQAPIVIDGTRIEAYELIDLPVPMDTPDAFVANFEFEGESFGLDLVRVSNRAAGFSVLVDHGDGVLVDTPVAATRTYVGSLTESPDHRIAASLLDDGVHALIDLHGDEIVIQPAADFDLPGPIGRHIVYRSSLSSAEGMCGNGMVGPPEKGPEFEIPWDESGAPAGGVAGDNLNLIELGIECDYEYFQRNSSSVNATVNDVELIINQTDNIYRRDLGIAYEITTIVVRSDSNDPYTSTSIDGRLEQFRSNWLNAPENSIIQDVAQMFSGVSFAGSTIGLAWVGSICTDFRFSVVESRYTNNLAFRTSLSAHEMGHNWDSAHCDSTSSCHIMCSGNGGCDGISGSNLKFGTYAQGVIGNFLNSRPCDIILVPPRELCFADDFEGPTSDSDWIHDNGTNVTTAAVNEPEGIRSLNLDSTGSGEFADDEIRTNYLRLNVPQATLSYYTQHRGVEAGERLLVEYLESDGDWIAIGTHESDGVDQDAFEFHQFELPSSARYDGGRIRIRVEVNESNDDWYVDDFRICDEPPSSVPNDECVDRIAVFGGDNPFTTIGSTDSGIDDALSCSTTSGPSVFRDVWFEFTAFCTGPLSISTCDGTDFDTRISVYDATAGCPTSGTQAFACNDDGCGTGSDVSTFAIAGQTFIIRVGSPDGSFGDGILRIECNGQGGPPNDECVDAEPLSDGINQVSTIGATGSGIDDPLGCSISNGPSVDADLWYTYQSDCTGILTIATCGSGFDTRLSVYDALAGCPSSGSPSYACNDDSCGDDAQVITPVLAGQILLIRIGSSDGTTGDAQILIDCEPFDQPCPEDLDGNGTIDGADLGLLLGAWGTPDPDADINGDGTVNGADLGLLLGAWGESC
ncbi:MAG: hypothetical protein CMJ52_03995 [Planctomycetaceae bacterium]|nr:hypothetical protein [Planctomycetaceae bacterium]